MMPYTKNIYVNKLKVTYIRSFFFLYVTLVRIFMLAILSNGNVLKLQKKNVIKKYNI